jgi:hypothetical protein
MLTGNDGNLAKSNHTFVGWNTSADGNGTHYDEGASYTADAALTLHPEWTLETTPPTLLFTSPADEAVNVAINNGLVATFDEAIRFGSGTIQLRKSADDVLVQSYDVTNPAGNLSLDGATLTITPSGNLAYSTGYYVKMDATAIEDLAGNAFAGISDATAWNFTTRAEVMAVFADDFEPGANSFGGTTADVASYTVATTSGQANTTLWVRASSGYYSSRNGLIDETENGGANFTDPGGTQAYGFRYSNTGVTSAAGKIGTLTEGQTITVSFDVCVDGYNGGAAYDALLVLFDEGAARNAVETADKGTAAVLARASGTTAATDPYQTVSFSYIVGDPVIDNNGPASGTSTAFLSSLLGKDVALRFDGATNSANIDNVSVTISGVGGPGPVDHFVISPVASPQTVGTPITGITITALDANDELAAGFTGTVTFGGTAGITGTSASFVDGVLDGVTITPGLVGNGLTFTVDDGADHTGSITFDVISIYDEWAVGDFTYALIDTNMSANPDGDSLTNLQEFAFGTDPTAPSGPIGFTPGGSVTNPGTPLAINMLQGEGVDFRAVFARRKDHAAAGLNYTVQFSVGLDVWVDSNETPTVLTGENSDGEIEAVSVPYPVSIPTGSGDQKPTFFRVGVSQH